MRTSASVSFTCRFGNLRPEVRHFQSTEVLNFESTEVRNFEKQVKDLQFRIRGKIRLLTLCPGGECHRYD